MEGLGLTDYNINLADEKVREELCDDTSFIRACARIRTIISSPVVSSGMIMHLGMTREDGDDKKIPTSPRPNICPTREEWIAMKSNMQEAHRRDAALLLRLLSMIMLIITAGRDVFFIVPWPSSSSDRVMAVLLVRIVG